ncbi:hypothetical protein BASA81_015399 [Batrachochytrium salamandrivorans]|nr:hypothetical protein BASA81_015399 [Batrachochytrium salamandrivorans]
MDKTYYISTKSTKTDQTAGEEHIFYTNSSTSGNKVYIRPKRGQQLIFEGTTSGGSGTPAGQKSVQFNGAGVFAGDEDFFFTGSELVVPSVLSSGLVLGILLETIQFIDSANNLISIDTSQPSVGDVLTFSEPGVATWLAQSGEGGSPGGVNGSIQFNDDGVFGGFEIFTYIGNELFAPSIVTDMMQSYTISDGTCQITEGAFVGTNITDPSNDVRCRSLFDLYSNPITIDTSVPNVGDVLVLTEPGVATWQPQSGGGGGTPAGSDKAVQFNSSGVFGADDNFTYGDNQLIVPGVKTECIQRSACTWDGGTDGDNFEYTEYGSVLSALAFTDNGYSNYASVDNYGSTIAVVNGSELGGMSFISVVVSAHRGVVSRMRMLDFTESDSKTISCCLRTSMASTRSIGLMARHMFFEQNLGTSHEFSFALKPLVLKQGHAMFHDNDTDLVTYTKSGATWVIDSSITKPTLIDFDFYPGTSRVAIVTPNTVEIFESGSLVYTVSILSVAHVCCNQRYVFVNDDSGTIYILLNDGSGWRTFPNKTYCFGGEKMSCNDKFLVVGRPTVGDHGSATMFTFTTWLDVAGQIAVKRSFTEVTLSGLIHLASALVPGFIAHEAQEVVHRLYNGQKDDVFENGSIKPQGIDASN